MTRAGILAMALLISIGVLLRPESPWTPQTHASPNPIQAENANQGTDAWQIPEPSGCADSLAIPACQTTPVSTQLAGHREIEGYASAASVNLGGTISLMVSTSVSTTYYMQIFRMGWYGGLGGRLMTPPGQSSPTIGPLNGSYQGLPTETASPDYLAECNWPVAYTLTIPTTWTTGYYLVKLIRSDGYERYIIFTVRDDSSTAPLVVQSSVTTWQAYNYWGGIDLYNSYNYDYTSSGFGQPTVNTHAGLVSFDRPYDDSGENDGAGQFFEWEVNMVRFLERNGWNVTYVTNVDVDLNPNLLVSPLRAGFLSVGHDEYWSANMRTNVTNARDQGVNLGWFSGNSVYWRIEFASDAAGTPDRRIVCYKNGSIDPYTVTWASAGMPENSLIGQDGGGVASGNYVVQDSSNWIYAGTGLTDGSVLPNVVGYEYDHSDVTNGASPPGLQILSRETLSDGGTADSTVYTAASGAVVVSMGSIQWSWGLDSNTGSAGASHIQAVNAAAQQITTNVLNQFLSGASFPTATPTPPITPSPTPTGETVLVVYDNAVSSGFSDNSYAWTTRNSCDTTLYYDPPCSYSLSYTAWGAISFTVNGGTMSTSPYNTLQFDFYPNGQLISDFAVFFTNSSGNVIQQVALSTVNTSPLSNGWILVSIPVSQLNPPNVAIGSIQIKNQLNQNMNAVNVDDEEFTGAGTSATPTSTATATPTNTPTNTPTPTATNTPVPTATSTNTPTPKPTATPTRTPTPKPTATNTPVPTVPGAPQNLTAGQPPAGVQYGVQLHWHAPASNGGAAITNYKVYRSTSAGTETYLTTVGNVTSYIDSSTTTGTVYYYKMSAVNSVGEGRLSNEASAKAK